MRGIGSRASVMSLCRPGPCSACPRRGMIRFEHGRIPATAKNTLGRPVGDPAVDARALDRGLVGSRRAGWRLPCRAVHRSRHGARRGRRCRRGRSRRESDDIGRHVRPLPAVRPVCRRAAVLRRTYRPSETRRPDIRPIRPWAGRRCRPSRLDPCASESTPSRCLTFPERFRLDRAGPSLSVLPGSPECIRFTFGPGSAITCRRCPACCASSPRMRP